MIRKYLWYVIRHKWFVFVECCKDGIAWQGLVHDLSKLRLSEFMPYATHFYGKVSKNCYNCKHLIGNQCDFTYSGIGIGDQAPECKDYESTGLQLGRDKTGYYKPTDTGDHDFDFAWLLHQKRNRHHWQWWILPEDSGGLKVLEMPVKYRKEMICDWRGAGRAQRNKTTTKEWYEVNKHKMQLGSITREWIEQMLH